MIVVPYGGVEEDSVLAHNLFVARAGLAVERVVQPLQELHAALRTLY